MAEVRKVQTVEIWLYKGTEMYIGKTRARRFGPIITCSKFDASQPVVWFGQKSYTIYNGQSKRNVLFYDTLTHRLFRPMDMSPNSTGDMITQTSINLLQAARDSQLSMGLQDSTNAVGKWSAAIIAVVAIMALVFIYLLMTNPPSVAGHVAQATTNALASHPIGPNIVPTNS